MLRAIIFLAITLNASSVRADNLEDAFASCKAVILANLVPKDQSDRVEFPTIDKVNWTRGDEFYFAFSSGLISGGTRAKPDWLTGSNKPSASCVGSLSKRTFDFVTVNGQDVEFPRGF